MGMALEQLIGMPKKDRDQVLRSLSAAEVHQLLYTWRFWARPKQLAPSGDWNTWLILTGRGWGKTRVGSETIREHVISNKARRIAIVGRTAADTRDVMVEGESGIIRVFPPDDAPKYEPSKRRVTFSNGAIATLYSADEPDLLRGPEHDMAWADELAAWRRIEAWDNLQLGLRLGSHPRCIVTTTPKPRPVIKDLLNDGKTVVTRGSTYENAGNLASSFLQKILAKYEGTRLGRQELHGEVLDDTPGALWRRGMLEENRVREYPELVRIVVGVDPSASDGEEAAECGIIIGGIDRGGHGYILEDVSTKGSPDTWGRAVVTAYHKYKADRIVAEVNQGGSMVEHVIWTIDSKVSFKAVRATKGKYLRAEPISALYEQQRVHHAGYFSELEDQMTSWVPGEFSPDRLDALVWCLTELMLGTQPVVVLPPLSLGRKSPWA